jgi:polyisoprenoid-binding protein YceI
MSSSSPAAPAAAQLLRDGTATGSWVLDGARSEIRLVSRSMWGLVPVKGVFRRASGDGLVSSAGEVTGTVTVAAGSVDTGHKGRDKHLRSADFFDADRCPDISFTADGATASGSGLTVAGRLSVRGQTRPVSLDLKVSRFAEDKAHLDGELHVNRADFGLTWNRLGAAAMDTTIIVHAVFTRGPGRT